MSLIAWRKYQAGLRGQKQDVNYSGMFDGLSMSGFQDVPGYQIQPVSYTPIPFKPSEYTPKPYPGGATSTVDAASTLTQHIAQSGEGEILDELILNKLWVKQRLKIPVGTDMFDAI